MPLYGGILWADFLTSKLMAIKSLSKVWNQLFWVISPSDIFKNIIENY
jgi:hypothetical protein